jgi:hypothetical protein
VTSTAPRSAATGSYRTLVSADLPARTAGELAEAVDWWRRALVAERATGGALDPHALGDLAARLTPAPGARAIAVRLDATEAATVAEAARRYLADRGLARYQPPAERARVADLEATLAWLDDAQARLLLQDLAR